MPAITVLGSLCSALSMPRRQLLMLAGEAGFVAPKPRSCKQCQLFLMHTQALRQLCFLPACWFCSVLWLKLSLTARYSIDIMRHNLGRCSAPLSEAQYLCLGSLFCLMAAQACCRDCMLPCALVFKFLHHALRGCRAMQALAQLSL